MGEDHLGTYHSNRAWADKFISRQKEILSQLFGVTLKEIRVGTVDEDIAHGIDLLIVNDLRIGMRVRRYGQFRNDLPIRTIKNKYGRTELQKMKAGEVDYFLYAEASAEASRQDSESDYLDRWLLLDCEAFQRAGENWWEGIQREHHQEFVAINLDDLDSLYGPLLMAAGSVVTTTTTTDTGGVVTTVTSTKTVHPSFAAKIDK